MKKPDTKKRLISGLIYLLLFIPFGFLGFLYVYFHYGKKDKFMRAHADNTGLLFAFGLIIFFFITVFPYEITSTLSILSDIMLLRILSTVYTFLIIIFALTAFFGKKYEISNLFGFLNK